MVPRDLLSHYLGMLDPSCALTVDHEVTRHCAYNLPAVAFTLGRRHWPALRNLYRALAVDCQVLWDIIVLYFCEVYVRVKIWGNHPFGHCGKVGNLTGVGEKLGKCGPSLWYC